MQVYPLVWVCNWDRILLPISGFDHLRIRLRQARILLLRPSCCRIGVPCRVLGF